MPRAVIVEVVRPPVGRRSRKLAGVRPDGPLLRTLVDCAGIGAAAGEDASPGCIGLGHAAAALVARS